MPKVTFEIKPEQRKGMDANPQVNWSEVLRRAVDKELRQQEIVRHMEEEATDPLVKEMTALVEKGMAERYQRAVEEHRRRRKRGD